MTTPANPSTPAAGQPAGANPTPPADQGGAAGQPAGQPAANEHWVPRTEYASLQAEFERERQRWQAREEVYRTGFVDPDGLFVAEQLYQRLPEAERPASLAEWIRGQQADPSKRHRALSGFFADAAAPAPASPGAPPAAPPPPPPAPPAAPPAAAAPPVMGADRSGSSPTGPTAGAVLTREAALQRIASLAEACRKSGDWKPYDAERATLMAAILPS